MRRITQQSRILAIILLGWLILLWQLADRSLWVDEFLTMQMIRGDWGSVVAAAMADLHPPLYFLALRAWVLVAGSSDFAVRLFSVMAGVVSLALMPSVARRLAGERLVIPATLLLAFAPAFVEFSRMTRYYSLTLMLGLLSTKWLLDALDRGAWKFWLAYGLAATALLYTFYPCGILIPAHGLIVFSSARGRALARRWLATLVVTGVAFVPWFGAVALQQVVGTTGSSGADLARSGLGFLLGVAMPFYTFSVGETVFPWRPEAWVGLVLIGLGLLLGLRSSNRGRWQSIGLFLISIIFMSVVTTFVSAATPFLNVPVRGLFTLPFFLLVAVIGLMSLTPRTSALVMGVLLIVWMGSLFNYFSGRDFLNPIYLTPSKEAAALVRQGANASDLVVSDYDSVFGYYFLTGSMQPKHLYATEVDAIQAALQNEHPARVWLVTIGRDQTRLDYTADPVRQAMANGYHLENIKKLLPIDPTYLVVKNWLLRRQSYAYRLTIEVYARN